MKILNIIPLFILIGLTVAVLDWYIQITREPFCREDCDAYMEREHQATTPPSGGDEWIDEIERVFVNSRNGSDQ